MLSFTKDYTKLDANEAVSNFENQTTSVVCKTKAKYLSSENSFKILKELQNISSRPFTVVVKKRTVELTLLSTKNVPTLVIFREKTLWDVKNSLANNLIIQEEK